MSKAERIKASEFCIILSLFLTNGLWTCIQKYYIVISEIEECEDEKEQLREKFAKQSEAKSVLKGIIALLILIIVAVSLSFASHDPNSYYVHNGLKTLFLDSFKNIVSIIIIIQEAILVCCSSSYLFF